jgi:hypothetical protein
MTGHKWRNNTIGSEMSAGRETSGAVGLSLFLSSSLSLLPVNVNSAPSVHASLSFIDMDMSNGWGINKI